MYRGKVNQSLIALIWLDEINVEIGGGLEYKCSRNGEKKYIRSLRRRFFNNTVYQFHGCFYHGCPNCFQPYDYNPVTNEKYCNLYSRTNKFTYRLERAGYKVIEKWECDFLKENNELTMMKINFFPYTPLEPRDALYGGRTSPACLFKEVRGKENFFNIDFTSLYPFVQKSKKFPTGHAQIYIKDECQQIDIKTT